MKVVLSMAGRGSRFSNEGYDMPKPLIKVEGVPMLKRALDTLKVFQGISEVIFVILREHEDRYNVSEEFGGVNGLKTHFVVIDDVTDGQLCTVLEARDYIDNDEGVLVMAADTFVRTNLPSVIDGPQKYKGIISVIDLPGDSWSFAKTDIQGNVVQVAEKNRISNNASTGLYYFKRGSDLVKFGEGMIRNKELTKGEFYVIPVYQKMIDSGLYVGVSHDSEMWDMGTPENKRNTEAHLRKNNGAFL